MSTSAPTALGLALLLAGHAGAARAQDAPAAAAQQPLAQDAAPADGDVPADIIVTAQKRAESVQDVPISLTVLDQRSLADASIDNILDLPRIAPSFSATRAVQAANTRLSIRGIGSSGNSSIEPSVGAFVDGIYIPRPGPLLATLNDIAGVEILRGPQGTLFGRNASMGAISFRTTDPQPDLSAQLSGEYGSFDRRRVAAIVNVPVGDSFAFRISGLYDDFDGFGRDADTGARFGDNRVRSIRVAARAQLSPDFSWTIKADYQAQRGDGMTPTSLVADTVTPAARANFIARLNGRVPILDDTYTYRNRGNFNGALTDDQWGLASDFSLALGDFTVRLLSGYREWSYRQSEQDVSNTPNNIYGRAGSFFSQSYSNELQLVSPDTLLDGRLRFVAGLYQFHERYEIGENVNLGPQYCDVVVARAAPARLAACRAGPFANATRFDFGQDTDSLAAFGQATFNLTDTIEVTGGIRYSHDDKDGDLVSVLNNSAAIVRAPDVARGLRFSGGKVTYRANATWKPTRDLMVFATYSTGFKSGGFDAGNGATLGLNRVFQPETTSNYEVGAKTEFLGRRLTANATWFLTDVDDFQLRSFNGQTFSVRNAGSIRQQGVEFELTARPLEGLSLGISGIRLASEYTDFRNAPGLPGFGGTRDLTGTRAPFSPKWQGVVTGGYARELGEALGASIAANYAFQSRSDVGASGDGNPQGIEPGYGVLGGRIAVYHPDQAWELYATAENLTKTGYCALRFNQVLNGPLGLNDPVTGGTPQRCVLGEPRQFRVGAKVRF